MVLERGVRTHNVPMRHVSLNWLFRRTLICVSLLLSPIMLPPATPLCNVDVIVRSLPPPLFLNMYLPVAVPNRAPPFHPPLFNVDVNNGVA